MKDTSKKNSQIALVWGGEYGKIILKCIVDFIGDLENNSPSSCPAQVIEFVSCWIESGGSKTPLIRDRDKLPIWAKREIDALFGATITVHKSVLRLGLVQYIRRPLADGKNRQKMND